MRRILLAALALALLAPLGAAAGEDLAWRLDPRTVTFSATGQGFLFSSARDTDLGEDVLAGSFDADAARLDARLSTQEPEQAEAFVTVTWTALVEYRDADGDGRFGLADPVEQRLLLSQLPHSTVATPLLAGGHSATATYALPANETDASPLPAVPREGGELRLTFTLVPRPLAVAGRDLAPTDLGIAAEVRGFPYAAGDSRLALVSEVATTAPSLARDERGVAVAAGNLTFGLAWDATATADGQAHPAPASAVSSHANRATLVQSWPRGERVEQGGGMSAHRWSADLGAVLESLPPGDWRFYALGLAAVAVALGVPSWRRLREP